MTLTKSITIIHNPKCSKSRRALALLAEHNVQPDIVEYLNTPLTSAMLSDLRQALNVADVRAMMRANEAVYADLNLDDERVDQDALIAAIIEHPILLQRPIVTDGRQAVIGRPPENVLSLLA